MPEATACPGGTGRAVVLVPVAAGRPVAAQRWLVRWDGGAARAGNGCHLPRRFRGRREPGAGGGVPHRRSDLRPALTQGEPPYAPLNCPYTSMEGRGSACELPPVPPPPANQPRQPVPGVPAYEAPRRLNHTGTQRRGSGSPTTPSTKGPRPKTSACLQEAGSSWDIGTR